MSLPANAHWKTHPDGRRRLSRANRLLSIGNRLEYLTDELARFVRLDDDLGRVFAGLANPFAFDGVQGGRRVLDEEVEQFYSGTHDSLPFKESQRAKAEPFEMTPGTGVHVPVNHPHWVTTANEVTISFALTIETEATHRPGAILAVMVAMFFLGFVMDAFEIIFVVVPIVAVPLLALHKVDPVWLGIMMAMNLQTSYMHPPLGPTLFFLRGVAPPEITTRDIYIGIIPFVAIQLFALVVLWFMPGLATWLPHALYGH